MKTAIKHTLAITALLFSALTTQAQVKIGSNPTVIETQSNLEVEASTPNRKVKVDKTSGKLTIQDGTEGTGKVLTSDAVGGASWQEPATLNIPVTAFSGKLTTSYVIPAWTAHDQLDQRIPLTPTIGGSGWNATTKRWVASTAGTYSVQVGLSCNSTTGAAVALWTRIWITSENGGPLFKGVTAMGAPAGDWQSVVYTGQLAPGDGISLEGYTMQTDGQPPVNSIWTGTCAPAYMTITKISN
ncbi:hypothetical protein [Larkinella sp.]|uniref:hypothetical protein n=1 Tax=Larkinella sp. TaxID=2034517 RepID=UPI003BA9B723